MGFVLVLVSLVQFVGNRIMKSHITICETKEDSDQPLHSQIKSPTPVLSVERNRCKRVQSTVEMLKVPADIQAYMSLFQTCRRHWIDFLTVGLYFSHYERSIVHTSLGRGGLRWRSPRVLCLTRCVAPYSTIKKQRFWLILLESSLNYLQQYINLSDHH